VKDFSLRFAWVFQSLIEFIPYLLTGLCAGAVALTLGFSVVRLWLWDWLLPIEKSWLLALKSLSNPTLDRYMIGLTFLAQGQVTLPLLVLIGGILSYRDRPVAALILAIALAGSWFLNGIFKSFFRRKRPNLWASANQLMDYSYPSGHAMSAISFYGLLAVNLTNYLNIPLAITAIFAACITLGVGFSRIYLGAHWPTDVLSGWVAGGIWLGVCLQGLHQISRV
jgi:undecaprenyl-diphosphatase